MVTIRSNGPTKRLLRRLQGRFAFPPPSPPAPHLAGGHELEAAQGSVIAWSPTGDVPTQADQADSLAKRIALLKGFL